MDGITKYVGLDISKEKVAVAVVDRETTKIFSIDRKHT